MENLIDKTLIIIVLLNWHRNMSCHFYEYKSKSVQPKPPEEPILGSFLFVLKGSSLIYLVSTTIQLPKVVFF